MHNWSFRKEITLGNLLTMVALSCATATYVVHNEKDKTQLFAKVEFMDKDNSSANTRQALADARQDNAVVTLRADMSDKFNQIDTKLTLLLTNLKGR